MRLFQPDSEDLKLLLHERRYLSSQQKAELDTPTIFNKKDAFAYWIQVYRQDQPVYLVLAMLGIASMPIYMLFKIIRFAIT